jgi:hypothetical protein
VSNPISDLREGLVALLEDAFPAAIVESGERTSVPSRDKDRICVFWPQTAIASDINIANPRMTIRFWVKKPKISGQLATVPMDDGPLEQASWDLSAALQPVRTTLVSNVYFEVASIVPVRDEYGIEAQLVVYTLNPAGGPQPQ